MSQPRMKLNTSWIQVWSTTSFSFTFISIDLHKV
jgi:hypothetical protein